MIISNKIYGFLKKLKVNNNREWFSENKSTFKLYQADVKNFGEELKIRLNKLDSVDRFKLFRIYRDVRFSKNKTPFKTHFGLTWHRLKPQNRGGYYLHIAPGNNFLACGFWDPNPKDLKRIRQEFSYDAHEFKNIINHSTFKSVWGEIKGIELKTAPRGFEKNHPEIKLIRKKQFIFSIEFSNKEVCNKEFIDKVENTFNKARPYLDYMSELLTTDDNGESII
jgi:uncharacterized protein (TIGR02453 family)